MIRNFTLSCCIALSLTAGISAADSSKYPAHFTPERISSELRDAFFEAFLNETPLAVERAVPDADLEDPKLRDVWLGNKPSLSAGIDAVEVEFQPKEDGAEGIGQAFLLTFLFKQDVDGNRQIIVRTSRPGSALYEGGIIFHVSGPRVRKAILTGQRGTNVLLGLPETLGDGIFGIVACPLTTVPPVRRETGEIETPGPIHYKPVSVRLNGIEGLVEGSALTGVRPGMARANISTSAGISNKRFHFDETYSKDPQVQVRYQGASVTEFLPLDAQGVFLQGVRLQLELQTNAGYTRETELIETVEVAAVDRTFEFGAVLQGKEMKAQSSSCYSVLRSGQMRNRYFKTEFVISR